MINLNSFLNTSTEQYIKSTWKSQPKHSTFNIEWWDKCSCKLHEKTTQVLYIIKEACTIFPPSNIILDLGIKPAKKIKYLSTLAPPKTAMYKVCTCFFFLIFNFINRKTAMHNLFYQVQDDIHTQTIISVGFTSFMIFLLQISQKQT